MARYSTVVALVFLLFSAGTLLAREEGSFAVLGRSEVLVERGAVVRGGDVGVIGTSRGEGRTIILGARIEGDVYGPSVRLDQNARVHNVFTNDLQAGKARYRSWQPFPDDMPRAPVSPIVEPETDHFIVPARTTALLRGHPRWVEVQEGGTLIVPVGEHFLDVLSLGQNSRLESAGPSRLLISSRLEVGPLSFIGPAEKSRGDLRGAANLRSGGASAGARGIAPARKADLEVDAVGRPGLVRLGGRRWGKLKQAGLNLTIVVAGPDRHGFAQAIIGRDSLVSAVVVVPEGTLRLEKRVRAIGTLFADKVSVGPGVVVDHPKYLGYRFDERCRILVCDVEAVSGGTINWSCSWGLLPAGTVCEDENECTEAGTCNALGQCIQGAPLPPPDIEANCQNRTCDPDQGWFKTEDNICNGAAVCEEPAYCNIAGFCERLGVIFPPGTACNDGVPGNDPDACNNTGVCVGTTGIAACLANNCSPQPGVAPDLTCWLNSHPKIRDAIIWKSFNNVTPWSGWTQAMQQELQQAFEHSWQWFQNGMTSFPGTIPPDPPVNQEEVALGQCPSNARLVLDEQTARQMFLAHVGHTLAGEIGGWIPWSLCDFGAGSQKLHLLLDSRSFFYFSDSVYQGYTVRGPVPPHPTVTYTFLANHGILGSTRLETIAGMVDWARRMKHLFGGCDTFCAYQYCGIPASRMMEGTVINHPQYSSWYPDPEHWTFGCGTTASFFKAMLRTANIPVNRRSDTGCGHVQVQFPSEELYLTHGDDPYSWFQDSDPAVTPPIVEFLIDHATFTSWFDGIKENSCDNIGRRIVELAIEYLPNKMVNQYCLDVWKIQTNQITDHSQGSVFESLDHLYTFQELTDMDLWGRLAQQAINLGYWCAGM